jgi:hypothetical protein
VITPQFDSHPTGMGKYTNENIIMHKANLYLEDKNIYGANRRMDFNYENLPEKQTRTCYPKSTPIHNVYSLE